MVVPVIGIDRRHLDFRIRGRNSATGANSRAGRLRNRKMRQHGTRREGPSQPVQNAMTTPTPAVM